VSTSDEKPPDRQGRWARYTRAEAQVGLGPRYVVSEADAAAQQAHFGVARDQIKHDFVISHVLDALAPHADQFVFYGGTALSRTILDGLRLSEDIDLLSVGPRKEAAAIIDNALRNALERNFGIIEADPWLSQTRNDTTACTYRIGGIPLKMQLIDGRNYTPWPRQQSEVSQRYAGLPNVTLTTYTAESFVGAKTVAWCDTSRNAPRDLYDLWALAEAGYITAKAAAIYRHHGPSNSFPNRSAFPNTPPTEQEWTDALGHQCILQVGPTQAYDTVVAAWVRAAKQAGCATAQDV